tara:strand:- start:12437 stop:14566 length:2130 start_codon:yes stop_codon:yes gene_type:complete
VDEKESKKLTKNQNIKFVCIFDSCFLRAIPFASRRVGRVAPLDSSIPAMDDDPWSALDEELEKCLSSSRGKKRGKLDSLLFGSSDKNDASSATPQSGVQRGDAPLASSHSTHTKATHHVSAVPSTPNAHTISIEQPTVLDEWSALDEELARLESKHKKKNRGGGQSHNQSQQSVNAQPHGTAKQPIPSMVVLVQGGSTKPTSVLTNKVPVPVPTKQLDTLVASSVEKIKKSVPLAPSVTESQTPERNYPEEDEETLPDVHIAGTCEDMCPEQERLFRQKERELDFYERVAGSSAVSSSAEKNITNPTTTPNLCIKKYTRIVDCPSPDMIRTKSALEKTTKHLYSLLGGKADAPPAEWETLLMSEEEKKAACASGDTNGGTQGDQLYPLSRRSNFLWDRLRSVRQDVSLQGFKGQWVITMLEEMVRFAVAAEYLLCEDTTSTTTTTRATHNSHLHVEQLAKTLTTLSALYRDGRKRQGETDEKENTNQLQFPNEPEMLSYQLLLRLDTHGPFRKAEGTTFLRDLRGAPIEVLRSKEIETSLEVRAAYEDGNITKFFSLIKSKKCSFLQACCLHKYFSSIRKKALQIGCGVWNKTAVRVEDLGVDVLRLDARFGELRNDTDDKSKRIEDDTIKKAIVANTFEMAKECGLTVTIDETFSQKLLLPKETCFVPPNDTSQIWRNRRERIIDRKAPTMKGGYFRWRALVEGKAGR